MGMCISKFLQTYQPAANFNKELFYITGNYDSLF